MRKPGATGPVCSILEISEESLDDYFTQNPLQKGCYLVCPFYPLLILEKGKLMQLLQQVPAAQRANVIGLDLDFVYLTDEELSLIPSLFPTLQEISLGLVLSPEALARLVEALPNLQSLGLRSINLAYSADAHIEQLTQSAKYGYLQSLKVLLIVQANVSPEVLKAFISVLPKLEHMSFVDVMVDRYTSMLVEAFNNGFLKKLKEISLGKSTELSSENMEKLCQVMPCCVSYFENFLDDDERSAALDKIIQDGHLNQLIYLNLNQKKDISPLLLASMIRGQPHLQEIDLIDMDLTDEHMRALADESRAGKLNEIRCFHIKDNPKLTMFAVAEVTRGMPKLISLRMSGMNMQDKTAHVFANGWQNLINLDLSQNKLSEQALQFFIDNKPSLKFLNLSGTEMTDGHIDILVRACCERKFQALKSVSLGGRQNFTGKGLKNLAEVLPSSLTSLSFANHNHMQRPPIISNLIEGLYEAASHGHLGNLCSISFGIIPDLGAALSEKSIENLLVSLICCFPRIEYLDLYCVATDSLINSILASKTAGKIAYLKTMIIMECYIQPSTLKRLHFVLPEQPLHYFEMGFGDEHAASLIEAAQRGFFRRLTGINLTNNPIGANKWAELLSLLPDLCTISLNGQDLMTDKFEAIAAICYQGKLQKVSALHLNACGRRKFSSESLANILFAFPALIHASLNNFEFTDGDFCLLADRSERGMLLQSLALVGSNDLDPVSPKQLARFLSHLPVLTNLTLTNILGDEHISALLPVVLSRKWSQIYNLSLRKNPKLTDVFKFTIFLHFLIRKAPALRLISLEQEPFGKPQWTSLLSKVILHNSSR